MNLNHTFSYLGCGLPEDIARLKAAGYFQEAVRLIDLRLKERRLSEPLLLAMTAQREMMLRAPEDYPLTREEALAQCREHIPDFTEAEFDALRFVTRLVESAKKEIVLIDPYSDASTLEVLAKKTKGVKVRLVCKATNWSKPTATEIAKFNKQYKGLEVLRSDNFHDRFVIIDGSELYNLGSSVNSLGRRLTTYTTRDPKEIVKLLAQI